MYSEIDSMYKSTSELNDVMKSSLFNTIDTNSEPIKFESTKTNISVIQNTSERMETLYHKLFSICKDCLTEIKHTILEAADIEHDPRKKNNGENPNPNKNSTNQNISEHKVTQDKISEIIQKTEVISHKITQKNVEILPKDTKVPTKENTPTKNEEGKVTMINEKLEKLKNLKEKKEQMLNQKAVKFEDSSIMKMNRKNPNQTEIDPSDSVLNEGVQIRIPQSNICEVNKPATDINNNYKLYTSDDDDDFQGDSQIILHFDDFGTNEHDERKEQEIDENLMRLVGKYNKEKVTTNHIGEEHEKTLNDTVVETGNSFMKSHRRSRSQVIQKQLYTYSIKPHDLSEKESPKFDKVEQMKENPKVENRNRNNTIKENKDKNVNNRCIIY